MRLPLTTAVVFIIAAAFSQASTAKKATKSDKPVISLSEMGVDFGAAELGRYAKLGLSEDQKKEALSVVRVRKPKIEKLCGRMTKTLAMSENDLVEKKAKVEALTKIQAEFKTMQNEIITSLHALVTKEQMAKLVAMKKEEARKQAKEKQRSRPS